MFKASCYLFHHRYRQVILIAIYHLAMYCFAQPLGSSICANDLIDSANIHQWGRFAICVCVRFATLIRYKMNMICGITTVTHCELYQKMFMILYNIMLGNLFPEEFIYSASECYLWLLYVG